MNGSIWPGDYASCRSALAARLNEPAASRIQLLTGPRQVGKTTLLLEQARTLGPRAVYLACDGPEAALPGAWDRAWALACTAAADGPAVLLLDEVHHVPDWSNRLKGEWDRVRRLGLALHVVATGSSALWLGAGSRESLAGRFERLTLTHWNASSLVAELGLPPDDAVDAVVQGLAYPGVVALRSDPARLLAYLRDAIVEPALGRDLLSLVAVRKPALLRQVFAVCAASPARIVSLQKLQGQLAERGSLETVAHYLQLLGEAFLIAALERHSAQPIRRRAAPPKLVILNNALLAAADPRGVPERSREPDRYGAWVENACLAHAWNSGQRVACWREEPLEVDGVFSGTWGDWVVEVKTAPFGESDLRGLSEFSRRYPSFRPLVLCEHGHEEYARRLGIHAMPWRDFLLGRPSAF